MSDKNGSNNQMLLGFLGGISVVSVIALIILSIAFVSAQNGGGFAKKSGGGGSGSGVAPDTTNALEVLEGEHIRGNPDADITIIEWSDFQCPFCQRFTNTLDRIVEDYGDKVRVVYRHFPLDSIHPYARKAAEASECAGEQNNFWEYHDLLYAQQSSIGSGGVNFLKSAAGQLNLDQSKFDECLDSGKYRELVDNHYKVGLSAGVTGTPGSFLNGRTLGGAVPYESLKASIESLL
jgi:protein-disulfide isomerase